MKKTVLVILAALVLFILEAIVIELFPWWFRPNFLLLLVIYVNLVFGIRYSILAAVTAGFLHDSYASVFGLSLFGFVLCAYAAVYVKRFFYEKGSPFSRVLLAFVISSCYAFVQAAAYFMSQTPIVKDALIYGIFPEVAATTLLAAGTFRRLQKMLQRLSLTF